VELAGVTQYLTFGADLGKFALLGLALASFAGTGDTATRVLLVFSLVLETGFGFMSGFKYQVLAPFLIFGFCRYAVRGRLPRGFTAGMIVLLALSYLVIEPFRAYRYGSDAFEGRDLSSIGTVMIEQLRDGETRDITEEPLAKIYFLGLLRRTSNLPDAALSIQYKRDSELPEDAPAFLGDILLAPVYSVVPRLLWPSKPVFNLGRWYAINLLGAPLDTTTAASISPIGYLYLAGGGVAVVAGFLLLGLIQRGLAECFSGESAGAIVMLLCLAPAFAVLESSLSVVLTSLIRTIPLLLLGQYIFFKQ
jgi:hypothetical protein